jgi:Gpi18-like mannosyltransferase
MVAWFSFNLLKPHYGRPYPVHFKYEPSFFNHFMHWDAVWYTHIAVYGYRNSTVHIPTIAFFPGYPLIMKFIHIVIGKNISFLYILPAIIFQGASMYMLYLLLKALNKKESTIYMTILLFAFYPSSFFGMSAYPVSALNFFAISVFYLLVKRQQLLASVLAGLATLFGPLAVFLSFVVFFDIAKSKKTTDYPKAILYGALSLWGFFAFILYSFYKFKDPIAFVHAQDWWGKPTLLKRISNILMLIPHDIPSHPISTPLGVYEFDHFINLLIMIAYILIIVFAIDRLPLHYTLFAILIFVEYLWALGDIFINTSAFARLSYISVPLFIALANFLEDYPWLIGIISPLFFFTNFVLEALFVKNYWSI